MLYNPDIHRNVRDYICFYPRSNMLPGEKPSCICCEKLSCICCEKPSCVCCDLTLGISMYAKSPEQR